MIRLFTLGCILLLAPAAQAQLTLTVDNASDGGGIFNITAERTGGGGVARVSHSTISGNVGEFSGGGVSNLWRGNISLVNSTVSGNRGGFGGGIRNVSCVSDECGNAARVTLINSTVADNSSSGFGGGIDTYLATFRVSNSIIANNSGLDAPDCYGELYSLGHNLIGNAYNTGILGVATGNIIGADPGLGGLRNNGGVTLTHALLPGSPALGAGSNALAVDASNQPLTTDQRGAGFPRVLGGTVDVGAFEGTGGGGGTPVITSVQRAYPGFFLQGTDLVNDFSVKVDWKGTSGFVRLAKTSPSFRRTARTRRAYAGTCPSSTWVRCQGRVGSPAWWSTCATSART